MKKDRGFTLAELIAVIVILGLLFTFAIPVYIGITDTINKKMYDTKIQEIKSKSELFSENVGKFVFDINTLIQEGYLSADNELGEYKNPITNRDMACDIIRVSFDGNDYNATIQESDICYQIEELENLYGIVELYLTNEKGEEIKENSQWLKESKVKVKFRFRSGYENQMSAVQNLSWKGLEPISCDKDSYLTDRCQSYEVMANNNSIRNVKIQLQIKLETKNGLMIESNVSKNVLLDIQNPFLVSDSVSVANETYTNGKKRVEFEISDGSGSGIYGYSIIRKKEQMACSKANYVKANTGIQIEYLGDEKENLYYICIKDNVGNVTQDNELDKNIVEVKYIDNEKPIIKSLTATDTWAQTNKITAVVQDTSSGIVKYAFTNTNKIPTTFETANGSTEELTYTYTVTQNKTYYFFVMDRAGNLSSKSVVVNKVDTEKPTQTFSKSGKTIYSPWYTNLTITFNLKDSQSGIKQAKYCFTTDSTCTPTIDATLNNKNGDKTRSYQVEMPSNSSPRKVCSETFDVVNRSSGILCSDVYSVDSMIPSLSVSLDYKDYSNNVKIKVSASDTHSKIKYYVYKLDSNNEITSTQNSYTYNELKEGNHTIKVYVIDNAGNKSDSITKNITVKIDTIAPKIEYSKLITTWAKTDDLTFKITDDETGVLGYALTTTEQTPTSWRTDRKYLDLFVNTITLKENGTYYLWAKDKAGNISHVKIIENWIDRIKPKITYTPEEFTWRNTPITITVSASDAESGLQGIYIYDSQLNRDEKVLYTGPFTTSSPELNLYAYDNAGNMASKHVLTYIDIIEPFTPWLAIDETLNDSNVYSVSCEKNESMSTEENHCTIYVSNYRNTFNWYTNSYDGESNIYGRLYEVYKNSRLVETQTCHYDEFCHFPQLNSGSTVKTYALDRAGNRSLNSLVLDFRG